MVSAVESLLRVDYKALVSRADLHYDEPASRSEEGLPVGSGRMGSLVWTTPTQLSADQSRRVQSTADRQFPVRHSDYARRAAT
jgi:hypothetical protein